MFLSVWPTWDKARSRDFLKVVCDKLTELERKAQLPPNTVRKSHLQMASGER